MNILLNRKTISGISGHRAIGGQAPGGMGAVTKFHGCLLVILTLFSFFNGILTHAWGPS